MPPWLLILGLMAGVILLINPSPKDFTWYQGLRRPGWVPLKALTPMLWLLIHACFYFSALVSWSLRYSWNLVLTYVVLLVLVESYTWLMCRSRRLALGLIFCLLGWAYGLIFTLLLLSISQFSALLMLPYLVWMPAEALIISQMRRLNPGS